MSALTATPPRPAPPRSRAAALTVATVLGIASLCAFALGGVALFGELKKDDAGFLSTDSHRFATDRSAIVTQDLDLGAGAGDWFVEPDRYGRVRIQAEPRGDKPVFLGIARADDVEAYVRGRDHATVTELDYMPFDADYDENPAARPPADPATQDFWAASSTGSGRQEVTWEVTDGEWSVVLINADGSHEVDAAVRVGTDVPILDDLGWGGVGIGFVLALGAGGALLAGRRQRS